MLLTSNGKDSRKGIEKGGAILLTSNGRESGKGMEKGGAILLTSNVRGSTLSLYVKLAQKQIDYKIRQGLFFIIKECGNTTFLRLFVCQYFHENLVLFLPQATKSGDDDFILPL